jgi:hypothetical protein
MGEGEGEGEQGQMFIYSVKAEPTSGTWTGRTRNLYDVCTLDRQLRPSSLENRNVLLLGHEGEYETKNTAHQLK